MTALEKAIEAITEQQSKMEKDSTPYFVGEQLKDILRSAPPSAAEIVLQDLGTKGMSVEDCEKKIAEADRRQAVGHRGKVQKQPRRPDLDFGYGYRQECHYHWNGCAENHSAGKAQRGTNRL